MNDRALITMYAGDAEVLRPVSLPTFERYAARCGFDLIEAQPVDGLPAAWGKVAALQEALATYGVAVWIDADSVIFDGAPDLAEWMPEEAEQVFASLRLLEYGINTWLWGLRDGYGARQMLDMVWSLADRYCLPPWELAAVCAVMGEHPEHQLGVVRLPPEWQTPDGHFEHASAGTRRPYRERARELSEALRARDGEGP